MTKKLARLLRADIQETSDLKSIAAMLAGKGRGGDTLLAHITPKEVGLLKEAGGAGTVNPDTGLLEFYDWTGTGGITDYGSSYQSAPASSGGYYDSLPAATPGVYGADTTSNYYQFAPDISAPDISSPVAAPAGRYDLNYGRAAAEGLQMPMPGVSPVGFQAPASDLYQIPEIATTRPVPYSLQAGGAGTDALLTGTRPDVSRAGTPDKPFLSNEQMVRLGLTGGLGVYGALQQRKAAEQMKKATAETKALARPYQEEGRRLIEAAKGGELTPAAAQQYQALQAQLAQGASQRGGIGVAQAAAQAEAFRNQLLQGQYDAGLKVSSIGDNIALGAIRTGMQLDQQLTQANIGFYTQLGNIAAGVPTYRT